MLLELTAILIVCAIGRDLRTAITRAQYSIKAASVDMGLDHGQFSRQLDGIEQSTLKRLDALPVPVLQELAVALAERVGIPKSVRVGQRLRMARARLHRQPHQEQRHA